MNETSDFDELMMRVAATIKPVEDERLKPYFANVSDKEIKIIEAIPLGGSKTMSEMAKIFRISRSSLTIAINRLVYKGYVKRVTDLQDRRTIRLKLTQRGQFLYQINQLNKTNLSKQMVKGMDEQRVREVNDLLTTLKKRLTIEEKKLKHIGI